MSYLKETFGASNLKTTGYILVFLGIIMVIYSFFKPVNVENATTTDLKIEASNNYRISQNGLIIFALGLILVSVNR